VLLPATAGDAAAAGRHACPSLPQLPVYHPSKEEQEDPALYARNVREYMVSIASMMLMPPHCLTAAAAAVLHDSTAAVAGVFTPFESHPTQVSRSHPQAAQAEADLLQVKYSKLQPSDATLEDKRQYQHELRQRLGIGTQPKKEAKQNGSK
jgi:hypothetical protein